MAKEKKIILECAIIESLKDAIVDIDDSFIENFNSNIELENFYINTENYKFFFKKGCSININKIANLDNFIVVYKKKNNAIEKIVGNFKYNNLFLR